MENPITEAKKELIQWIKGMNEFDDLADLLELKEKMISENKIAEPQTEYAVKDDFDERFAKGIPHDEMRRRTNEFIRNLPWKK
ncbi:hypothetical protein [Chryseobacterium sp. GP-SGM7]|uniref:hypothetical protein n=1 Tax=Chryseobacterium sp. GP-SGM7 TaxID=3411323 RepID=UPI003B92B686